MHSLNKIALCFGALSLLSTPALADRVGFGLGSTVDFAGSDESTAVPLFIFDITTRVGTFTNNGAGFELDLVKNPGWETGPVVRINGGRDDSVDDDVVANLPEIEAAPEVGWHIGSGVKLSSLGLASDAIIIADVTAIKGVGDGHEGVRVETAIGLVVDVTEKIRLVPSFTIFYADDDYTNAFFGVDTANASAQLGAFEAEGGVEALQLALVGFRTITDQWSVRGVFAFNSLQGDAADSTIADRGSDTNVFAGALLEYNF